MVTVLGFMLVATVLTVTPGPDTALVLRYTLHRGRRAGLGAATGVGIGLLGWGVLTAGGLTAVLATSGAAYTTLRAACGLYLLTLAVRAWRAPPAEAAPTPTKDTATGAFVAGTRAGALTALLNPKLAVFFVALLPGLIPAGMTVPAGTLLLAGIQALIATAWYTLFTLAVEHGRTLLTRTRVRTGLQRLTAAVFAGFGIHVLAFTR